MRPVPSVAAACAVVLASTVRADWPEDPAQNLGVAVRPSEQVLAKASRTSDGGTYIGWFDLTAGNYDVRLQRLDPAGNPLWGPDGLLVSNHDSMSWIVNWDMTVDSADHAVLVFSDIRNGGDLDVYAYRIGPDQQFVWGPDGIALSDNDDFEPDPKVAETANTGQLAIVWSTLPDVDDGTLRMQRIDFDGTAAYPVNGIQIAAATGENPGFANIIPSTGDDMIVSWVRDISTFFSPRHIHAQKFAADGTALWGPTPKIIYDQAPVPIAYLPVLQPDGAGGAIFAWHRSMSNHFNCAVQRAAADGTLLFPANGVVVSTNLTQQRFSPSIAFDQASGDIYAFYDERNLAQSAWGVYGQRIDSAGQRLWGDAGKVLVPVGAQPRSFVRAALRDDGATAFWFEAPNNGSVNSTVRAMAVDTNGDSVWPGAPLDVSSVLSSKDDLVVASGGGQDTVLVWEDERNDGGDIYAQNINPDGSLGSAGCPADFNNDGAVNTLDVLSFLNAWSAGDPSADFNGDGAVNTLDVLAFLNAWSAGC